MRTAASSADWVNHINATVHEIDGIVSSVQAADGEMRTYALSGEPAVFSGDVLFQGSVGRVDLPGGDWATLLSSIESLVDSFPAETTVYPGHMGITTLGRERASNPFLRELAAD